MPRSNATNPSEIRSKPLSRKDALAFCPVRNRDVVEHLQPNGLLRLSYPTTLKPWFAKLAQRFGTWDGKPMRKQLELDEMGGLAWSLINGSNTVQIIVDAFIQEYGLERKEAEMSVTAFIKELGRRGIVGLR